MQKMFIDDWNRREFKYNTEFEGEAYHLIRDKKGPALEIVPNERILESYQEDRSLPKQFHGYTKRPSQV